MFEQYDRALVIYIEAFTEPQVVLAMARNLSIGNDSKIDPKDGEK